MPARLEPQAANDPALPMPGLHEIGARIGERWSISILLELARGACRFNALSRVLDGISRRTLSATLKHLERDGLVLREMLSATPLQVEYRLTPLGHSLLGPIREFERWSAAHGPKMVTARARFDQLG